MNKTYTGNIILTGDLMNEFCMVYTLLNVSNQCRSVSKYCDMTDCMLKNVCLKL